MAGEGRGVVSTFSSRGRLKSVPSDCREWGGCTQGHAWHAKSLGHRRGRARTRGGEILTSLNDTRIEFKSSSSNPRDITIPTYLRGSLVPGPGVQERLFSRHCPARKVRHVYHLVLLLFVAPPRTGTRAVVFSLIPRRGRDTSSPLSCLREETKSHVAQPHTAPDQCCGEGYTAARWRRLFVRGGGGAGRGGGACRPSDY